MKKLLSLLIVVCVTALFVSCQKDGVYNPSKKISKIITTYQYDDYSYSYSEVWKWGKKTLDQISDYDSEGELDGITYFTYDKNRLSRVQSGSSSYLEYHYDGSKLATADHYSGGSLYRTYTFTHTNGNITKIEDQRYSNWKSDVDKYDALELVLGKDLAQIVNKSVQKHDAKNGSKGTSKYVYDLTWKNGNVIKVEISEETDPTWKETLDAEYDTYNNPLCGYFWNGASGAVNHSKNNIVKVTYTETELNEIDIDTYTYQYTYDGKYPKTRRVIYSDGDSGAQQTYEYTK